MKPKLKQGSERSKTFAQGGSTRMLPKQAAGPARSGITGKAQTAAPGARRASGGKTKVGFSPALPAKAGRTGPSRKG